MVRLTYTNASDKNSGEIRVLSSSAEEANQIPQQQPVRAAICDNDRVIISEADTKVRPTEQQQSISHHHPDTCTFVNGKGYSVLALLQIYNLQKLGCDLV